MKIVRKISVFFILFYSASVFANEIYFPPITGSQWETISLESLKWNIAKLDDLYDFLQKSNTKAFVVLKDGRIALEKYFDSFTKDSLWYWASAGKTLTATLIGIAQNDGLLNISDMSSKYLGKGWTSCPKEKEDLITIRHQLTMTTGLDFTSGDLDCTNPECLKYKSDAGTQWYYHNAPYTLLEQIIVNTSGQNYNTYFTQKIKNSTGITGLWIKTGFNNVYFSNARSMARFGLLILNNGFWNTTNVIKDKVFLKQMITTSQELNKSYGYLWWLNGKESYMLPGSNKVFQGKLFPDAPEDMFSALGKDGQILNVVPSKGLIVVRMGQRPDDQYFISTAFNNQIWKYLNQVIHPANEVAHNFISDLNIYPNPASDFLEVKFENTELGNFDELNIYNAFGQTVLNIDVTYLNSPIRVNISELPNGIYSIALGTKIYKLIILK